MNTNNINQKERFLSLQREFTQINPENSRELSKLEIKSYLVKKTKNKLKENYLIEVLALMDENRDEKVPQYYPKTSHATSHNEINLRNFLKKGGVLPLLSKEGA